jgi:methionine sulfoxide reductase heme-binding subunit
MNEQILWFATRGAGIVSLALFTGVVGLGVLTAGRWQTATWPRFLTAELHRTIALLSLVFLGVHIATAVADPFTSLGIVAAAIPFASSYRPLWVGLGVISVDLIVALVATSLLRARIGQRTWRVIHWAAYAAWPLALLHGIGSGTDGTSPWLLAIDAICLVVVASAAAWRFADVRSNRGRLVDVARAAGTRQTAGTRQPADLGA